eukprot:m.68782 g.68782  ORF g.68782 m.68782 type:complete len:608 (+) comp23992_c0_seq1:377-2200(+)
MRGARLSSVVALVMVSTIVPAALWSTRRSILSIDSKISGHPASDITLAIHEQRGTQLAKVNNVPEALKETTHALETEMMITDADKRCTLDGCAFQFPGPQPRSVTDKRDLPRFEETCLIPADKNKVFGDDQHLPQVDNVVGVDVVQCQDMCLDDSRCIAWTHDRSKKSLAVVVSGRSGLGSCTLHGSFISGGGDSVTANATYRNCCRARVDVLYKFLRSEAPFPSSRKNPKCTSGLVRAGRSRTDQVPGDPLVPGPGHGTDLTNINIAKIGQCHGNNCLDVDHCAARYTGRGKFAFVNTDDLRRKPWEGPEKAKWSRPLPNKTATIRFIAQARAMGADYLFVVPADTNNPLTQLELDFYNSHGAKVVEVPWSNIPGMDMTKERYKHCNYGPNMDFIKTNVFGLDDYDAIVVYDGDVVVYGDITPIFKCAAQNYFLSASGPNSPMNMGFLAFKPSKKLRQAAILYGQSSTYSTETAWNGLGFSPVDGDHPPVVGGGFNAAACGQGFFWTFFYKQGEKYAPSLDRAFVQAGIERPQAFQVDRCIWNYQNEYQDKQCAPDFQCSQVRAVHKKHKITKQGKDIANGNGCFYNAPYNTLEALASLAQFSQTQ